MSHRNSLTIASFFTKQINGITTQGENIADNGGVKVAYFAYKKWKQLHGPEKSLPGLSKYIPEQLFWISAAQTWCAVDREWYAKHAVATDSHASNRFRVLGPLRNNKEFSKDFGCVAGSPMNPEDKCDIW